MSFNEDEPEKHRREYFDTMSERRTVSTSGTKSGEIPTIRGK
jgi:hypothetical protein